MTYLYVTVARTDRAWYLRTPETSSDPARWVPVLGRATTFPTAEQARQAGEDAAEPGTAIPLAVAEGLLEAGKALASNMSPGGRP